MARCRFCKDLERYKDMARDLKKKENINSRFMSSLTIRKFKDHQLISSETNVMCELVFCPMCGTKLVKPIRQKKNIKKEN